MAIIYTWNEKQKKRNEIVYTCYDLFYYYRSVLLNMKHCLKTIGYIFKYMVLCVYICRRMAIVFLSKINCQSIQIASFMIRQEKFSVIPIENLRWFCMLVCRVFMCVQCKKGARTRERERVRRICFTWFTMEIVHWP